MMDSSARKSLIDTPHISAADITLYAPIVAGAAACHVGALVGVLDGALVGTSDGANIGASV